GHLLHRRQRGQRVAHAASRCSGGALRHADRARADRAAAIQTQWRQPMSDKIDPKKPQNQTQDTSDMIGTAKPPPGSEGVRVPSDPQPVSDAEPIDPNHPELPRQPRVTPPAAPPSKDD